MFNGYHFRRCFFMDETMTIREAALFLGVTTQAVDLAVRAGALPLVAGASPRRIARRDLEAYQARKAARAAATFERRRAIAQAWGVIAGDAG